MKKLIIALVILAVVGIGTYYFVFSNNYNGTPAYTPSTSNSPSANTPVTIETPETPVASSVTVDIKNFAFSPSTLNIKTGTKVTWVNNDSAPHTIVSDSGSLLDSQTLSTGQSFSFTFTEPGSINYHCGIHPSMKGKVVVTSS